MNQLPSWILLILVFTVNNRHPVYPVIFFGFIASVVFAFLPFYANGKLVIHSNALELKKPSGTTIIEASSIQGISFLTEHSEGSPKQRPVQCVIELINEPPLYLYIGRLGFKGKIRRTNKIINDLVAMPAFKNKLKSVAQPLNGTI